MSIPRVRTRFAPSPTGNLHIGGARTALFAFLWARHTGGDFILRIEDTDKQREVPGAIDVIINGLTWLGIQCDEGPHVNGSAGPYIQSQRTELYKTYAETLLANGKAYRCFCTVERLAHMRAEQQEQKRPPQYDRFCRKLNETDIKERREAGIPFVVRLSVPEQGTVIAHDLLRGDVVFDVAGIDDQVLLKSDGFPTYHLANVVDDHEMRITHVIRGVEWLPSTPKHVLLYRAFGWDCPVFAHVSLFLSKNGGKMSKRDGETSLLLFRDQGYVSEAVLNFIAFLGWNPKTEEEFFTKDELIQRFDLAQLNTANAVFDMDKLHWINQHYLKKFTTQELLARMSDLAHDTTGEYAQQYETFRSWFEGVSPDRQESIWQHLKERSTTLLDVARVTELFEEKTIDPAQLVWKKTTPENTRFILQELVIHLEKISEDQFLATQLEHDLLPWITEKGWGNGDVLWPMRFALSGEQKSPSPFECAEVLGKEDTVRRLRNALTRLTYI